jgi:hypothetical protein
MRAMENHHGQADTTLTIAYLLSVLLHIVVLSIQISQPSLGESGPQTSGTIDVVLAKPPTARPAENQKSETPKPDTPPRSRVLTAAPQAAPTPHSWPVQTWSRAERSEMDNFLNELATEAKPQSGREMASQALATARQPAVVATPVENATPSNRGSSRQAPTAFSLEMYFDAFLNKLNRSAAFVKKDTRKSGYRKALVQILLNPNGTLKSYEVLRAGDQDIEIAYIKSVVDRATPFSAFPRDIAGAAEVLSVLICITPSGSGDGTGSFSRASPQECRD